MRYRFLLLMVVLISCEQQDLRIKPPKPKPLPPDPRASYKTYCNPVNIDYSYMSHYRSKFDVSYRSGADPAVINFEGLYYMFVTRSHGYWVSNDMSRWIFIRPRNWYFGGSNAPAAAVHDGKVIVYGDPSGRGPVIESTDPQRGDWETNFAVLDLPDGIQDPALFVDDDGRVYLYEGSSNKWPIRGIELDPDNHFVPIGEQVDLFNLDPEKHGWERFGQDHRSDMKPYIEGPWMVKHGDTYYLEYGAPGTQWNVYADGVYTSKSPLGPFEYAPYNPISYKPDGFLKGSGHGSTVRDIYGRYWHFATMAISVNYKFERRIGMYPAGFSEEGQMWVNTTLGDFPHYLPDTEVKDHKHRFTGWMLLSYNKPVRTNSYLVKEAVNVVDESTEGYMPEQITGYDIGRINDEEIRSYWVSSANHDSIYVEVDLEKACTIFAVQINYQDFNSTIFGRPDTLRQQFVIRASEDGKKWTTIADFSENTYDMPHAYVEVENPMEARYIRYDHVYVTNKHLAISEFRVFGHGHGYFPATPSDLKVVRQKDRRNATLSWRPMSSAIGYIIHWGINRDQINLSTHIFGKSTYEVRALNTDQSYYFRIEAFNENGVSLRTQLVFVE